MNIDEGKMAAIAEAESWLKQASSFYRAWQWELGDDAVKRAKSALSRQCFDYKPIFQNSREIPDTVKVKAPHLPQGFMIINGVDFNPDTHEVWTEPPTTTKAKRN